MTAAPLRQKITMEQTEHRAAEQLNIHTEKSVLAYCMQAGLFPVLTEKQTRCVCAAVSGGADSMALLHLLLRLAPRLQLTVTVCHVNHGLRGASADRDEAFVREACARLGVALTVYHPADVGFTVPEAAGEDWARRLRYQCFARQLEAGADWIATAHTASDQAETLLFRLARGTGVHGAAGIRPVRGRFVRPLLQLTRADTEGYCAAVGQGFVTDETNLSPRYARNRLRQDAIPAMQQANEAAVPHLAAFCDRMARLDAYFSAKGECLLQEAAAPGGTAEDGPWQLAVLRAAEPLVLETALHRLVSPARDAEEKYIRLLAGCVAKGGAVQVTAAVRFAARGPLLYRLCAQTPPAPPVPPRPLAEGEYDFPGGYRVRVRLLPVCERENIQYVHKKDLKNRADYAKLSMLTSLRTRCPGDRFQPAGRNGTKTLKKLFNEEALSPQQRLQLPLAAQGSRVVWLWGHGVCEGIAPDNTTKQIVLFEQCEQEEEQ